MKKSIFRVEQKGFTLLEMIIVISIIVILVAIAVPSYVTHLRHAKEAVLKEDLYTLRTGIEQYGEDKNKAPQNLDDLVSGGYIHAIPKDPFTNASDTWQSAQEDPTIAFDPSQPGITDVHSGSTQTAEDGTAYNTW